MWRVFLMMADKNVHGMPIQNEKNKLIYDTLLNASSGRFKTNDGVNMLIDLDDPQQIFDLGKKMGELTKENEILKAEILNLKEAISNLQASNLDAWNNPLSKILPINTSTKEGKDHLIDLLTEENKKIKEENNKLLSGYMNVSMISSEK